MVRFHTISHDAHEEKAHFHVTVVSNGYHSLRVTEASQELLGEGLFSCKAREALATDIIQSELQKLCKNRWETVRFHMTLMKRRLIFTRLLLARISFTESYRSFARTAGRRHIFKQGS